MKIRIIVVLLLATAMYSCNFKNQERAQQAYDSLRNELQLNQQLNQTLGEVGTLLDSIDANRNVLRVSMMEGTPYQSYSDRMHELNAYVRVAEKKIQALETESNKNRNSSTAYASAIKKLKGDLDIRAQELNALKEQVAVYKNQNDNLISTVSLQKAEIDDKLNQIKSKQEELTSLQNQVNELLVKSSVDQGNAFFARAVAVEETANRTHFAPKKKRNTRKEAIELYKMALNFGKGEAQSRIAALEKKI